MAGIKTDRLPATTCRNLLAGILFTAKGIHRQTLITASGTNYILESFNKETHSTIFSSRAAILYRNRIKDINLETLASKSIDELYNILAAALAVERSKDTIVLSISPAPTIVTFISEPDTL